MESKTNEIMLNCRMTSNPYSFKFYGRGKVFSKIQVIEISMASKIQVIEISMASPFISITSNNNMMHYIVGNYNGSSNTNTDASQFDTDHDIKERVTYIPIGSYTKRELGALLYDHFVATVCTQIDIPAESNMRVTLNDNDNWPQWEPVLPYYDVANDLTKDPPTENTLYYALNTLLPLY